MNDYLKARPAIVYDIKHGISYYDPIERPSIMNGYNKKVFSFKGTYDEYSYECNNGNVYTIRRKPPKIRIKAKINTKRRISNCHIHFSIPDFSR